MPSLGDRLQHAWNAFRNTNPNDPYNHYATGETVSYIRPDRIRLTRGNERSIVTSTFNRISLDCAAIKIRHVRLDTNGRFLEEMDSGLNECLSLSANRDQTARAFIQDVVMSMFDEGCIAIVPTDTTRNPRLGSFDIQELRVGKIVDWRPYQVKLRVYNENKGDFEEILMDKNDVAIIENPLYAVMNEPNSTLQRLIRKLNLLDIVDEQSSAGKLDLIIQLPYTIKTAARKEQAEARRKDIENQLAGTKYGIAYTDGTEKITQLNKTLNNNLMDQVEYLTNLLYAQLGLTTTILDGTADDKTMLNYYNRTVEPIMAAISTEMKRKFLTRTARSQKQSIEYYRDPFRLVPVNDIADIADKFTRNEILSSNEVRQIVGMMPVQDPLADQLRNKNINSADGQQFATTGDQVSTDMNGYVDENGNPIYYDPQYQEQPVAEEEY